ncbi:hypothetical protein RHMOL_Rhmol06G0221000 [Rhododendron molle]|uniref:Uncharacterized protein n=1 Tax=Rhododendron molle TaxID=49168 RepID=A0ACC0NHA8_RHOML|nr:hypothetical protein RHMOL_Rhmol06G0221000 [Rhododendron molle]
MIIGTTPHSYIEFSAAWSIVLFSNVIPGILKDFSCDLHLVKALIGDNLIPKSPFALSLLKLNLVLLLPSPLPMLP